MGLRFHKAFALNKFLRINISKSGLSLGVGPKGSNINLSAKGIKGSAGIPGTGISYRQQKNWSQAKKSSFTGLWFFLLITAIIVAVLYFGQK